MGVLSGAASGGRQQARACFIERCAKAVCNDAPLVSPESTARASCTGERGIATRRTPSTQQEPRTQSPDGARDQSLRCERGGTKSWNAPPYLSGFVKSHGSSTAVVVAVRVRTRVKIVVQSG